MLSWATSQFERLSQTVAPPPEDPAGRFAYCCQRSDEDGAIQLVAQLQNGVNTIVVPTKGQLPLHLACLHSMLKLARLILTQPGVSVDITDQEGNSSLHFAAMGNKPPALNVVKLLVEDMDADVSAKNSAGQTPYDVAKLNVIRQYLLPLQLQKETQTALANGGKGLIPGMDMGGLKVSGFAGPPPPTMAGGIPAPASGSTNAMPHSSGGVAGLPPPPISGAAGTIPPPPVSTGSQGVPAPPSSGGYAFSGSSSAAIYKPSGRRVFQADGFHSSSSDKNLQEKYGHLSMAGQGNAVPPPPRSAESFGPPPSSTGSVGGLGSASSIGSSTSSNHGSNPYAGGHSAFRLGSRGSRYVSYDAVTGAQVPLSNHSGSGYHNCTQQPSANVAVFSPTPPQGHPLLSVHSAPATTPGVAPTPIHAYSAQVSTFQNPLQNIQGTLAYREQQFPVVAQTPSQMLGAVGGKQEGLQTNYPPPPVTTTPVGARNPMTTTNNLTPGVAAATMFATPHPSESASTMAVAPAATADQGTGFQAFSTVQPSITPLAPMGIMGLHSTPEAAAAAFASPSSSTIPIAQTSGSSTHATAAATFASPPSENHDGSVNGNGHLGIMAEVIAAAPAAATTETGRDTSAAVTKTQASSNDGTTPKQPEELEEESLEPLSEIPLNESSTPGAGIRTVSVSPTHALGSNAATGGLPPPPIGSMAASESSNSSSAAELFASAPPAS